MNNKFDGGKVKTNIKKYQKKSQWKNKGLQLIKNYFLKLVETCEEHKNVKLKLVEDIWGP